jgi:tetratricopeptide (TPR) repeat protein
MDENPRIVELRKKLEKDPGSRLFAQLAEELRKEGKHDEAITVARSGLEKIPNYPSARLTLARALLDSGQIRDAKPELEQVVKASPDNIIAGRLLGEALESLGETIAAIKQYERALALSPGDKFLTDKLGSMRYKPTRPASQKGSTTRPPSLPGSSSPPGAISRPPSSAPPPSVFDAPSPTKPKPPAPVAASSPSASGPPKVAPAAMDETLALPNIFDAPQSKAAAPPAALPSVFDVPAPAALPSVFDAPAPAAPPPVSTTPKPAAAVPKAPTPPPAPLPAPASVAFDRDLASGTFSPGSLGVAELQRHFEAQAAAEKLVQEAEAPVQQYPDVEDTVGFGELTHEPEPGEGEAPSPAFEAPLPVVATASTQVFELSETEDVPELSPEFPAENENDAGAQTLPLNSVTLADLYLQQGLKAEASAVLSQVIRDEPSNEEAKQRLAQVSEAGVETLAEPAEHFPEVDVPEPPPFSSPSAEPEVAAKSPAPAESPSLAPVTIPFAAPVSIPSPPVASSAQAPAVVAAPRAAPAAAPPKPPSPAPVAPAAAAKPAPPAVPSPQPVPPRPPDKPKPAAVAVPKAPSPVDAAQARAAASRGTRSHVRDRTIRLLKAFQNAAEREAVQQRASELTIR